MKTKLIAVALLLCLAACSDAQTRDERDKAFVACVKAGGEPAYVFAQSYKTINGVTYRSKVVCYE